MTIAFEAPGVTLHHGDCIEVMRTMPDASVDAMSTIPPPDRRLTHDELDAAVKSLRRIGSPYDYVAACVEAINRPYCTGEKDAS